MEKLKPLTFDNDYTDFDLSQIPICDDRLMTKLVLDDYDWMNYTFTTIFPTTEQGFLNVSVEYSGLTTCTMTVLQRQNRTSDEGIEHTITFDTDIFQDFIVEYLIKHLASWYNTYAFNGGEEAVKLYNTVLEKAENYSMKETKIEKE